MALAATVDATLTEEENLVLPGGGARPKAAAVLAAAAAAREGVCLVAGPDVDVIGAALFVVSMGDAFDAAPMDSPMNGLRKIVRG